MAWQKIKLAIPPELNPSQRQELADLVIEHIVDRTERGLDKNGKPFPKYSKEYIKSLDFRNAGKSPGRVDLKLSGDMLAAIKLLNHSSGNITVGFVNGTEENDKAEGNILGTYGQSSSTGKRRDFLGIQPKKFRELLSYVSSKSDPKSRDDNGED